MRAIRFWQWMLAIISAVLQVLIFPSSSLFSLSWIALVPLLVAILRSGVRAARPADGTLLDPSGRSISATTSWQGFLLGYASGLVWYAGSCYWIYHVMHVYGGLEALVAVGVLLLFCLIIALWHGLFGLLLVRAARSGLRGHRNALLLAPFLWAGIELARTRITGFPWDLLGTAQVDNIPVTRVATITGVYGVSFLIVLVNAGITAAVLAPLHQRRRFLPIAFALAVMLQLGVLANPRALRADHNAVLVQANVQLDEHWTLESFNQLLNELKRFSTAPHQSSPRPRLIVWPEAPAPFWDNDDNFRISISSLARQQNAYVIVDAVGTVPGVNSATPDITNRAALIAPTGDWVGRYDKIHLVPFGEYIPFKSIFVFAQKLTREVGDYRPGAVRTVFNADGERLGVFICYESVFPDEVRQFAGGGAQVLVNLSNDGWYGEHGAPGQHLNLARMRAIENNRWLLRDTNTGVTASIDPYGRIVAQLPPNHRTALLAPYGLIDSETFYSRHGDWFAWTCAIISILALLISFRLRAGVVRGGRL